MLVVCSSTTAADTIRGMTDDRSIARATIRAAAIQAAQAATRIADDAGDPGALADQFEAAGLDDLAKRGGLDARTQIQTGD